MTPLLWLYSLFEYGCVLENLNALGGTAHPPDIEKILLTHCVVHMLWTKEAIVGTTRGGHGQQMLANVREIVRYVAHAFELQSKDICHECRTDSTETREKTYLSAAKQYVNEVEAGVDIGWHRLPRHKVLV